MFLSHSDEPHMHTYVVGCVFVYLISNIIFVWFWLFLFLFSYWDSAFAYINIIKRNFGFWMVFRSVFVKLYACFIWFYHVKINKHYQKQYTSSSSKCLNFKFHKWIYSHDLKQISEKRIRLCESKYWFLHKTHLQNFFFS